MDGSTGRMLKQKLIKTFEKRTEMQKGQQTKAIVISDKPARKRGGKKYRKQKERLGMTELRLHKNRVLVSGDDVQYEDTETGKGFGALTQAQLGLLKINSSKHKQQLSQKQQKRLSHNINAGASRLISGIESVAAGLKSSLAFAPNQGIELVDPHYVKTFLEKRPSSEFFSKESGFKTVLKDRENKILKIG